MPITPRRGRSLRRGCAAAVCWDCSREGCACSTCIVAPTTTRTIGQRQGVYGERVPSSYTGGTVARARCVMGATPDFAGIRCQTYAASGKMLMTRRSSTAAAVSNASASHTSRRTGTRRDRSAASPSEPSTSSLLAHEPDPAADRKRDEQRIEVRHMVRRRDISPVRLWPEAGRWRWPRVRSHRRAPLPPAPCQPWSAAWAWPPRERSRKRIRCRSCG